MVGEVEAEVASLLGDPGAGGICRAAGEPDAAAGVRDEEEHVVAAQDDALNREEVAGDDARRLRSEELAPARPCAPRRWPQPCAGEKATDAGRRDIEAKFRQLAADPAMAPARILARELKHKLPDIGRHPRPPAPTSRLSPLPAYERLMPAQQRPRRNQKHADRRPRQVTGRGCQQSPISCAKLRLGDLATQNLELMP